MSKAVPAQCAWLSPRGPVACEGCPGRERGQELFLKSARSRIRGEGLNLGAESGRGGRSTIKEEQSEGPLSQTVPLNQTAEPGERPSPYSRLFPAAAFSGFLQSEARASHVLGMRGTHGPHSAGMWGPKW